MQQKPDATPRATHGVPAKVEIAPPITETMAPVPDAAHLRMDPRVLNKMQDAVAVMQQDYAGKLAKQVAHLQYHLSSLTDDKEVAAELFHPIAHEIRGIAGTFGRPLAGQIAARICDYLEAPASGTRPCHEILRCHIDALAEVTTLTLEPQGLSANRILQRLQDLTHNDPSTRHGHTRAD